MEDIYLDEIMDVKDILNSLKQIFPDLTVFYYDFNEDPPVDLDFNNPKHIFFNSLYSEEKFELRFQICIYRTPNEDYEQRQIYIGKIFSDLNNVRVLVPFNDPEERSYPYYSLFFEKGKIFLADDNDTNFADGTEGVVKVIKEYAMVMPRFDAKAQLIK
ncbi:MAG: hypothetical protein REI64_02610 [Pedobacter sp.]|uniref:hypothetical protein n=1 Tax=Pedobacter sp. TaxID=1411316 RepID=UPI0028086F83|nr:hypothetical protein [Pedobacter sp.]MDQ8003661.1 hypothetical protein [Pedobacter sp.]